MHPPLRTSVFTSSLTFTGLRRKRDKVLALQYVRLCIVLGAPQDDIEHHGNQVQALFSQRIEIFAPVLSAGSPREYALRLKKGKAGGKHLGRDALFRFQELILRRERRS